MNKHQRKFEIALRALCKISLKNNTHLTRGWLSQLLKKTFKELVDVEKQESIETV